ncbi:MAG: MerR family DNA-binding protein [Rhodococcus sp. (in: high G+C Gram-positive bacteria)]
MLDIRADGHAPCSHVADLLTTKLGEVQERIGELTVLREELTALIERSKRLDPADCTAGEICHILRPPISTTATPNRCWARCRTTWCGAVFGEDGCSPEVRSRHRPWGLTHRVLDPGR